jgi:DHA2 family multidrug resistance protein-like MFS transporter
VGQTAGAIIMTQFFTLTSVEAAPRIGLGIAAVLTLAAGLVSVLRATDAGSVVRSVDCGDH